MWVVYFSYFQRPFTFLTGIDTGTRYRIKTRRVYDDWNNLIKKNYVIKIVPIVLLSA